MLGNMEVDPDQGVMHAGLTYGGIENPYESIPVEESSTPPEQFSLTDNVPSGYYPAVAGDGLPLESSIYSQMWSPSPEEMTGVHNWPVLDTQPSHDRELATQHRLHSQLSPLPDYLDSDSTSVSGIPTYVDFSSHHLST